LPESYRTSSVIKTKPLWQIYYPDRDLSRIHSSAQHDMNNQNGNTISKEKSSDDIEVIMLNKNVRRGLMNLFSSFCASF
jgi:hypothetical protein